MVNWSLTHFSYIGFRFLRYKFSPWLTLAIAPLKFLTSSRVQRIHVQNNCLSAIARIDFASVYGLLNDLLW
ncbi:hypothetical protein AVDCRST_MAG94-2887 [uncultured Leptolyngbya sp.]|uniref:Uncharacterized protein n=1 Tax=uncultured Leptolyngbya sp. TaxID=332963 RepID=A0A6J4M890_9CYAN|nr:hypothetical protein AVDCRST_MAG94-2887 [uncultured Leptolyngbya sp.]